MTAATQPDSAPDSVEAVLTLLATREAMLLAEGHGADGRAASDAWHAALGQPERRLLTRYHAVIERVLAEVLT